MHKGLGCLNSLVTLHLGNSQLVSSKNQDPELNVQVLLHGELEVSNFVFNNA